MNSNSKGKVGERELASYLKEHGFDGARRGIQYQGGPDSPDVVGLPGHHIECKRVEALSLYDALAQAQRDAHYDAVPLVCHRRNRRANDKFPGDKRLSLPWVAILTLEDYLLMVRELQHLRVLHADARKP